jgi:predicted  nucleic acid-binding Zn-ribbon protein
VRPPNAEQTNVQKKALMDNLSRDLDRARGKRNALAFKRDALASDVTTLTAQIAELEARLSEEKDRRERERIGGEIEGIKKRLKETATAFAPVIAGLCDDIVIDSLLRELQRQTEALRTGNTALDLPQSVIEAPELPKKNDRLLLLPAWLRRNKEAGKKGAAEDRLSTTA